MILSEVGKKKDRLNCTWICGRNSKELYKKHSYSRQNPIFFHTFVVQFKRWFFFPICKIETIII